MVGIVSVEDTPDLGNSGRKDTSFRCKGSSGDMRGDDNAIVVQQRMIGRKRLRISHIKTRTEKVSSRDRGEEGILVHDAAP